MFRLLEASTMNTTIGNMIFVLLSFVILLICVKKFAWGNVMKIFKDREERISNDLDSAEENRIKAQELKQQRESELNRAHQDAMTIVKEAKTAAERNGKAIVEDAKQDAILVKEKADRDIQSDKEKAYGEVKQDVATMSLAIASKIMQKELDADAHEALIDACIEGLGNHHEKG